MTDIASTRWARALVIAGLGLTLRVSAPAYAQQAARPDETSEKTRPPPAPGTSRLIRIGPEMVVKEDGQGRITMAEEPAGKPNRGRGVVAIFLGLLTAGAVLTLGRNELSRDLGGEPVAR